MSEEAFPQPLVWVLVTLKTEGVLSPTIQEAVLQHPNPQFLKTGLRTLMQAEPLSLENVTLMVHHPHPKQLGDAMECLVEHGLYPLYRSTILNHPPPYDFALNLSHLNEVGLLSEQNVAVLDEHAELEDIAFCLGTLNLVGLLNQENFNYITAPAYQPLVVSLIWYLLPPQAIHNHWAQILQVVWHPHPEHALLNLSANILQINPIPAVPEDILNDAQSTHTASVHKSVSNSAKKLAIRYGHALQIPLIMVDIQQYLQSLDATPMHQAAKNALTVSVSKFL